MPYSPGQTGNPGGRPKVQEDLKAMCRRNSRAGMTAILKALKVPGERVGAATLLFAYGFGRPPTTVNVRVVREWNDLSDAELQSLADGTTIEALADESASEER